MRNGLVGLWMIFLCLAAAEAKPPAGQEEQRPGSGKKPAEQHGAPTSLTRDLIRSLWETSISPVSGRASGSAVARPDFGPPGAGRDAAAGVRSAEPATRPTTAPAAADAAQTQPAGPTTAPSVREAARPATRPAPAGAVARPEPTTRPVMAEAAPLPHAAAVRTAHPSGARAKASPTTRPAGEAAVSGTDALAAVAQGARDGRKVPDEALARIRGMSASSLTRPLTVADGLFRGGQYDAALVFYELAMKKNADSETRAWLLFQIGNCQRRSDPAAARKAYQQLVEGFADSPWTPVARMLDRLVAWRMLNKPEDALKGSGPNGQ